MFKKRDMTQGKIYSSLFLFALPLVIGNIFQLTYNVSDSIVLGWFSSNPISSQAAVGIANPIMNIFIALISGLCVGAAIHTSELYGQKDQEKLKKQITTMFISGGILVLIITVLFILLLKPIIHISNVTDEVLINQAYQYLLIIGIGYCFTFLYNAYASVLRSIGDSMASLIFLVLSCILNVGLNILFVLGFNLDVLGVALSTTISQILCAIAIVIYGKIKYKEILVFKRNEYRVDFSLLKTTASYAFASCLQQIVLWVGKYLISTQINKCDVTIIDAFSSASKIDDFVFSPAQNFGHATAIFIAQNRGAGNIKRAKQGHLAGTSMNLIYGVFISLFVFFLREPLLNLFLSNDETIAQAKSIVVDNGTSYLRVMSFLYLCPCITNSIQSYFRGLGKLNIVFLSTLVQIIARVSFVFILINLSTYPLDQVAWATGIGWAFMISFELPFLIYYYKTNKGMIVKS